MAFEPFLAYSASAGSGKTFALSVRYAALLFLDQSPASILAATFTNKAAAEMRQRIVDALRCFGEDRAFLQSVAEASGLSEGVLLSKKTEVLERFLKSPNFIVTMDAFFAFVLRSSAFEIGLEPDFKTEEIRDEALHERFLDEVYRASLLDALVALSIEIEDRRFHKIFAIFEELYRLEPLLPDIKAEPQNKKRLEAHIEELRREMLVRLERAKASASALRLLQVESAEALIRQNFFEKASLSEHRYFAKAVRSDPELEDCFAKLKEAAAQWFRLKEQTVLHYVFMLFDYFKNAAVSYAKDHATLHFDDVAYFTYRLMHHSLSRDFLHFKLDTRFRHILLDEFQDTSTLQFLILKPLIDEMVSGSGQSLSRSFFYVGDTKQSLYRFRGGEEGLFERVAHDYKMRIAHLDTNYRSSKAVVETVNALFAPVMEGFVPQRCRQEAAEGFVEVVESEEVVATAIAKAQALIQAGADPAQIAFLVFTNKEGVALQEACRVQGVATVLQTRSSLRYVPIVAALVAGVRYCVTRHPLEIAPLCALSGIDTAHVEIGWFHAGMTPLEVIDRLIVDFKVFFDDANILRLLDVAARFEDVEEFLEAFEKTDIDVAPRSLHGARIMTVHGSKGLEFDYVIVLDRIGRGASDTSVLLFSYDVSLHIRDVKYRLAGRDRVDASYAALLEANKQAADKERLNVLYVALTRAAEGMIVVKKPQKSVFEPIGLTPMRRGIFAIQTAQHASKAAVRFGDVALRHYGAQHVEVRTQEAHDAKAVRFGTALHYALEMLASFRTDAVEEAIEAMRNRYGRYLSDEEIASVRRRIEGLVASSSFQALLQGATLHKEIAFVEKGEFRRIDLLLEYEEGAYVVDYKSAYARSGDYRAQVRAYVEAVARFWQKPVGGALLFLDEDRVRIEEVVPLNIS